MRGKPAESSHRPTARVRGRPHALCVCGLSRCRLFFHDELVEESDAGLGRLSVNELLPAVVVRRRRQRHEHMGCSRPFIWPRPSSDSSGGGSKCLGGALSDFGDPITFADLVYFDCKSYTSTRLVKPFPTVPCSPSSSQGKSVYSGPTSARAPLTVHRASRGNPGTRQRKLVMTQFGRVGARSDSPPFRIQLEAARGRSCILPSADGASPSAMIAL